MTSDKEAAIKLFEDGKNTRENQQMAIVSSSWKWNRARPMIVVVLFTYYNVVIDFTMFWFAPCFVGVVGNSNGDLVWLSRDEVNTECRVAFIYFLVCIYVHISVLIIIPSRCRNLAMFRSLFCPAVICIYLLLEQMSLLIDAEVTRLFAWSTRKSKQIARSEQDIMHCNQS